MTAAVFDYAAIAARRDALAGNGTNGTIWEAIPAWDHGTTRYRKVEEHGGWGQPPTPQAPARPRQWRANQDFHARGGWVALDKSGDKPISQQMLEHFRDTRYRIVDDTAPTNPDKWNGWIA